MVNLSILRGVFNNMKGRVKYRLGGKAVSLNADSHTINSIDCSGFVRFALYRASLGAIMLPDGSVNQHDWVVSQKWHKLGRYSDVGRADVKDDFARLFIAFASPTEVHPVGHVWLVWAGETYESHGGVGVDSRDWNAEVLMHNVTSCYEVPKGEVVWSTR